MIRNEACSIVCCALSGAKVKFAANRSRQPSRPATSYDSVMERYLRNRVWYSIWRRREIHLLNNVMAMNMDFIASSVGWGMSRYEQGIVLWWSKDFVQVFIIFHPGKSRGKTAAILALNMFCLFTFGILGLVWIWSWVVMWWSRSLRCRLSTLLTEASIGSSMRAGPTIMPLRA